MTPAIQPTQVQDLRPTTPEEAVEDYIIEMETVEDLAASTVDRYQRELKHFLRFCEEMGIDNMNDLNRGDLHDYKRWLHQQNDYEKVTIKNYLNNFRAMLRHTESYGGVRKDLHEAVKIPRMKGTPNRKDEVIKPDRAERVLAWLTRYRYASRKHVVFALIWDAGLREGAVRALDLGDFEWDEDGRPYLNLVHRPETDTPLKNGEKSEGEAFLKEETGVALEAWIADRRPDTVDEYGREPLISTTHGRASHSTIQEDVYEVTAPCFIREECPDCTGSNRAKCPEALSPHPIRRGAITRDLNLGLLKEHVSERYDVSVKVLEENYDARTPTEKRKLRQEAYTRLMQELIGEDMDEDEDGDAAAPATAIHPRS